MVLIKACETTTIDGIHGYFTNFSQYSRFNYKWKIKHDFFFNKIKLVQRLCIFIYRCINLFFY